MFPDSDVSASWQGWGPQSDATKAENRKRPQEQQARKKRSSTLGAVAAFEEPLFYWLCGFKKLQPLPEHHLEGVVLAFEARDFKDLSESLRGLRSWVPYGGFGEILT